MANPLLGTSFHWYLMIECDSRSPVGKAYAKVAFRFMQKLSEVSPGVLGIADCRRRKELQKEIYSAVKENLSSCYLHEPKKYEGRRMVDLKKLKSCEASLGIAKTVYHPFLLHCHYHSTPGSPSRQSPLRNHQYSNPTSTLFYYGSKRVRPN